MNLISRPIACLGPFREPPQVILHKKISFKPGNIGDNVYIRLLGTMNHLTNTQKRFLSKRAYKYHNVLEEGAKCAKKGHASS